MWLVNWGVSWVRFASVACVFVWFVILVKYWEAVFIDNHTRKISWLWTLIYSCLSHSFNASIFVSVLNNKKQTWKYRRHIYEMRQVHATGYSAQMSPNRIEADPLRCMWMCVILRSIYIFQWRLQPNSDSTSRKWMAHKMRWPLAGANLLAVELHPRNEFLALFRKVMSRVFAER